MTICAVFTAFFAISRTPVSGAWSTGSCTENSEITVRFQDTSLQKVLVHYLLSKNGSPFVLYQGIYLSLIKVLSLLS